MLIQYFPDFTIAEKGSGPIRHFFKDLQGEKPPFLWTMVRETLEKVRKSSTLEDLERQGWVARLPGVAEPIYVFKIPPKGRKAGVTRIYFAFKKNDFNTIVLLSAEKKHGINTDDRTKINQAVQRYREIYKG